MGAPSPGRFIGSVGSRDSYGWNPNFFNGTPTPYLYDYQSQLKSPAVFGNSNPNLILFTLYQFRPTVLNQWAFNGQALAGSDGFLLGTNFVCLGTKALSVIQNPGLSFSFGLFDISVPGTSFTLPTDGSVLNTSGIASTANNILFAGPAITTAGQVVFQINFDNGTGFQIGATLDGTNTVQWNIYHPINSSQAMPMSNYDSIAKLNYFVDVDHITKSPFIASFTIDPTLNTITFGANNLITFSGDPGTGISPMFSAQISNFLKPVKDGWILNGAVGAGGSQWYFADLTFTHYWNLQFSTGPANPSFPPVMDSNGNFYTMDTTSGNVFVAGSVSRPSVLIAQPTLPYPLPQRFQPMKLRLRKNC